MNQLADLRAAKNSFFASPNSPIEGYQDFEGLAYYPESDDLRLVVPLSRGIGGEVTIGTSDGQTRTYQRAGIVRFEVNGAEVELTLLNHIGDDGYFLPFRDATSGETTYGGGRYLDIDLEKSGTVSLDFNLAYNPYCAYSEAYSCPLPPVENWLTVPIEAGELSYQGPTS